MKKLPRNATIRALVEQLESLGWEVSKAWPDFVCWDGSRFAVIQVRGRRGRKSKREQERVMQFLAGSGIECYRWDAADGFHRIVPPTQKP